MKQRVKQILGEALFEKVKAPVKFLWDLIVLYSDFATERDLFRKHSTVFYTNGIKRKEAILILNYHSLEKGFLFSPIKPRFAKARVITLHRFLNDPEVVSNVNLSQIRTAYSVVCKYYELHANLGVNIEDYFSANAYERYRKTLHSSYKKDFEGVLSVSKADFYSSVNSHFHEFSNSRRSVRDFTGEIVAEERITSAVNLALNSPSVCNRQSNKVYLLQNKEKIDLLLKVQAGFRGYSDNVNQLLIVTGDRNYFYTVGEKSQLYIDGGVFLMNLLYSLHYHRIANCPANWGKTVREDKEARKIIELKESEKIICLVPIGESRETVKFCLSQRRDVSEVLQKLI